jgi:hypothetical protein
MSNDGVCITLTLPNGSSVDITEPVIVGRGRPWTDLSDESLSREQYRLTPISLDGEEVLLQLEVLGLNGMCPYIAP